MNRSEKALVTRAKKGDRKAFEILVKRHQNQVYNLICYLMGQAQEAEDLTQEVFIKVYRAIKGFRFKSSFNTWLYRITVNTVYDRLRKRPKYPLQSLDEPIRTEEGEITRQIPAHSPSPLEIITAKELQEKISKALDSLSLKLRTIFILREIEDLSYKEIASILGCSEGTVKSRLYRARMELRKLLRPYLKKG